MANKDPEAMLQRVLALIDEDVSRIRTRSAIADQEGELLDADVAWTLCRYGDLLNRAVKAESAVDQNKQKKLSTMTTEELRAKAAELLGKE